MNKQQVNWTVRLLTAAVLLTTVSTLHADDTKAAVQDRINKRIAILEKYRDQGKAGETVSGTIEAVNPSNDAKMNQLMADENADRKLLWAFIAKETGGTVDDVAKKYARRLFEIAKPEHYLKDKNGVWHQKKDVMR